MRSSARSDSGSTPTTLGGHVDARRERGAHAPPAEITCALVSMKPSGVITTPEPDPRRPTRRFATEGPSRSATPTTTREYASERDRHLQK